MVISHDYIIFLLGPTPVLIEYRPNVFTESCTKYIHIYITKYTDLHYMAERFMINKYTKIQKGEGEDVPAGRTVLAGADIHSFLFLFYVTIFNFVPSVITAVSV